MAVCENCGAELGKPDMHGNLVCQSCGRVKFPDGTEPSITSSDDESLAGPPLAPPTTPPQAPTSSAAWTTAPPPRSLTITPTSTRPSRAVMGLGCVLPIVGLAVGIIVAVVAIVLAAQDAIDTAVSGSGSRDVVEGAVIELPGEPGRATFVALARRYDTGRGATIAELLLLQEGDDDAVWISEPIGENLGTTVLVADAANVYVLADREIVAVDLASGEQRWSQALSDTYPGGCATCLQATGAHVVVKTIDGMLRSFDGATGAQAWERRLADTSAPVTAVGGRIVVVDRPEATVVVDVLDAASGQPVSSFAPVCERSSGGIGSTPDSSSILVPGADGTSLFVGFGLSPGCWQRWDVATGQLAWDVRLDDGYVTASFGGSAIEADGWLQFASQESVGAIDVASGTFVPFPVLPDFELAPLGGGGGRSAFWARGTRGTPTYEIWVFDNATGAHLSRNLFGEAEPATLAPSSIVSDEDGVLLATVADGEVWLTQITASEPRTIVSQRFPLGGERPPTVTGAATLDAESGVFTVDAEPWRGTTAVFVADEQLVLVDAASGTLSWTWPG